MGTVIISFIVVSVVAASIRSIIKAKKNGKSLSCGGDCSSCIGNCANAGKTGNETER